MAEKNNYYRNFSNRKSFNNIPCSEEEELVPAVLTNEMKITLKPAGLDYNNVETWTFPHGKKVPVVFIPNKRGFMDMYMKLFNNDVERYLKHTDDVLSEDLSLDEFLEKLDENDECGWDPTGTTALEDTAASLDMIAGLIADVSEQDAVSGKIVKLLAEGFQKNEIIEIANIQKGKSAAYAFIEKTQKLAKEIYEKHYK